MADISREQDSDGNRWYELGDTRHMSVTTVLDHLEEDTTGLYYWKQNNDGSGDAPYHQHLYWFSGPRGTLCHYQALNRLADGELWRSEESDSLDAMLAGHPIDDELIDEWRDEGVPVDEDEICYSILKNKEDVDGRESFGGDMDLLDICYDDVEWFAEQFEQVCDDLSITDESVISVEQFLLNDEIGYGGQTDLVYENPDGETVVADLKTSSGLRQKHRLQAVAYATAVEHADDIPVDEVDTVEVIRLHPDSRTIEVHSHSDRDIEYYTDEYWFEDKYGDFEYESLDEMMEKFSSLVKTAHNATN